MDRVDFPRAVRQIDLDKKIAFVFMVVAIGFFLETYRFQTEAAVTFPRVMSAIVILGSLLIIFEAYLPGPIQSLVSDPVDVIDTESLTNVEEVVSEEDETHEPADSETIASETTMFMVGGFIVISYIAGFFLAAFIFVLTYYWLTDQGVKVTVSGITITLVCILLFWHILNLPLLTGSHIDYEPLVETILETGGL